FTRKAAAEMRQRVLAAIAAADRAEPAEDHRRLTWSLARAARARDRERGWNLAATPARLRIETLDALALRCVARMPWLCGLGTAPAPAEDAEPLYRAAARGVLRHLDADLGLAVKTIADLLPLRDQWQTMVAAARHAGVRVQELMQRDLGALVRAQLEQLIAALGPEGVALARGAGADALPGPELACLPQWHALAKFALTDKGSLRKKHAGGLHLSQDAEDRLHRTRMLPAAAPASELIEALVELLPQAELALQRLFAQQATCDFTGITLAAVAALGEEAAPSALAFALDGRLQHLLVDECQDTSHAQFALLDALVREWQPGDGRTLFLVGDPMQSIYRWRNARLELFLRAAAEERLGPVRLERLRLRRNFRSAPALVDWCNGRFSRAFPAGDDLETGAARFEAAVAAQ